jgi:hypothetical protein
MASSLPVALFWSVLEDTNLGSLLVSQNRSLNLGSLQEGSADFDIVSIDHKQDLIQSQFLPSINGQLFDQEL